MNSGYIFREVLPKGADGQPLIEWLAGRYRHSSAATWAERIRLGEVLVNGARPEVHQSLKRGQSVEWHRPPWTEPEVDTHFTVLFEDQDLLAVAKPRGLPTLPGGGEFLDNTLLSLVRRDWPEASPMHRLGRSTTGIVLFALTPHARNAVQKAWRTGGVRKTYRARALGAPPDRLTIDTPIGPIAHPLLGTVHAASAQGKASCSEARLLERREGCALLEVTIGTGRPHQIRIHLAAAGFPLVGDPLYAAGGAVMATAVPGDAGYFLHAWRLALEHPTTLAPLELVAPPPAELLREGE